eukprot:TRINITY_DN2194_c0_g1_i1.p1 TRINITY_DN2194_c0_g1~~TRINITY_DN2194_c0_g1_i1.p1  ORF type:complete len:449 (-),score=87.68 TRINITY_DN2194_c0_g1_i1:168-1514(-)
MNLTDLPLQVICNFSNLQISDDNIGIEDDPSRKLFVGGLSWTTTEEGLRSYFESLNFGVDKVTIMRDKLTGRSRGFGFLSLSSPSDVDRAVSANLHLDGRKVEAKRAIPKRDMDNHAKKIFVGGIPISLTNGEFRKYFEKFGPVLETQVMTDRESGRSRGFGFVTYEDEAVVEKVLKYQHNIHGKPVEVKRAEPKKQDSASMMQVPLMMPMSNGLYVPGGSHGHPTYSYPPRVDLNVFGPQMYSSPLPYDPSFYLPTQGLMYIPPPYDPTIEDQSLDWNCDYNQESFDTPEIGRNSVSSITNSKFSLNSSISPRTSSYSPPSDLLDPPDYLSLLERTSPFSSNSPSLSSSLSPPRTERAYTTGSTGFLPEGLIPTSDAPRPVISIPNLVERKKRAETDPSSTTRQKFNFPLSSSDDILSSLLESDINWRRYPLRKAPGSEINGGHRFF